MLDLAYFGFLKLLRNLLHLIFGFKFRFIYLLWSLGVEKFTFILVFVFGTFLKVLLGLSLYTIILGFGRVIGVELFSFLEALLDDRIVLLIGFFVYLFNVLKFLFVFLDFLLDLLGFGFLGVLDLFLKGLDFNLSFSLELVFEKFEASLFLSLFLFFVKEVLNLLWNKWRGTL